MKFKKTYHYFVSYLFKDYGNNIVVGDCEIFINHKIKSYKDLEEIKSLIVSQSSTIPGISINILNWKFLRKSYK